MAVRREVAAAGDPLEAWRQWEERHLTEAREAMALAGQQMEVAMEAGAEVVTSGDGGQVPIGIPVGLVRVDDDGRLFVDLQEDLHNLSYVRIISTRDIEPPPGETQARTLPGSGR